TSIASVLPVGPSQIEEPGSEHQRPQPAAALPGRASHLPLRLTRFFGRETEICRLRELLQGGAAGPPGVFACRLVTLTGPGGSGKTRLALEVAAELQAALTGEAPVSGALWFVSVADLTDASQVPDRLLEAMQAPRLPD